MSRFFVLASICVLAIACKQPEDDAVVKDAMIETTGTLSGAAAYRKACARCHDDGLDDAPITGDEAAWVGRSWLWEAVLVEHAKEGFLGMPAQGESRKLSDTEISLAAEYMMRQVYPEVPPD